MTYENTPRATFLERPNRFVARVRIGDNIETVHVKNTGRCKELLLPDAQVTLAASPNPARKTKYDLISVYKESLGWVNIDSLAPNAVVKEWLEAQPGITLLKPEFVYGDSRVDFYLERGSQKALLEVKGCTLEIDRVGYFPDAPTQRGVKHLKELQKAVSEGYEAYIAFVIAMPCVTHVLPNIATHPEFGVALAQAMDAGVKVLHLPCIVTENSLCIDENASMD